MSLGSKTTGFRILSEERDGSLYYESGSNEDSIDKEEEEGYVLFD